MWSSQDVLALYSTAKSYCSHIPVLRECRNLAVHSHCPSSQVSEERYRHLEGNLLLNLLNNLFVQLFWFHTFHTLGKTSVLSGLCKIIASSAGVHWTKGNTEMQREGGSDSVACHLSGQESQKSYPIFIEDRGHSLSQQLKATNSWELSLCFRLPL